MGTDRLNSSRSKMQADALTNTNSMIVATHLPTLEG